jgi:hypothetical protein
MESLNESKADGGFFKHVFKFDQESKSEMLNIIQYAVLAIIPIVILNKLTQRFIPEADEEKSSVEISLEVLAQIIIMFLVILIIHRIITYIPTYSGDKYTDFSVTNIVLAMLVIILSLQTKLGEKVSILVDRVVELWEGRKEQKGKGKGNGNGNGNGNVKVSQPISQNQNAMTQSVNSMGSTSISSLPTMQQPSINYDNMYQQDSTPLIGASTPGMEGFDGPMAANAMTGGAFGGAISW